MNDQLPAESTEVIPTLVDHDRDARFIIAFCPICDRMAKAPDDGRGLEGTAARCIAEIKLHISKRHRPKPPRVKVSISVRRR